MYVLNHKEKDNSQARRSGNHGIPASEVAFAVLLNLRYVKYLVLHKKHVFVYRENKICIEKLVVLNQRKSLPCQSNHGVGDFTM